MKQGQLARLMTIRRPSGDHSGGSTSVLGGFGMSAENVSSPVAGSITTSSPPPNRTLRRNARRVPSGDHAGAISDTPGVDVSARNPVPSGATT